MDPDEAQAIDTDDDNSGAAPVAAQPDDNSGAAPVAAPQQSAIDTEDQPGFKSQGVGPLAPVGRGIKHIISYLSGMGAANPNELQQAAAQVDPQGQLSPDDRNILAVDRASQSGGPEAAWKLVQSNRVAFNAKQAFGYAAINGNGQKPPDLNAAIDAANQAGQHVLDGSSVQFAPSQGGVTATVKMPGSTQPQQINLTTDQFKQYLNVGGDGQWDRLMENTIPATLQRLSQSQGQPGQQQRPVYNPVARDAQRPAPPQKSNFGKTPSTLNLSGNDNVQPPAEDNSGIDPQLQNRANTLFPSASQGDERNRYMASDIGRSEELQTRRDVAEQQGINSVNAARARNEGLEAVAKTKAGAWQYASDQKLAAAKQQIAAKIAQNQSTNANQSETHALKLAQTLILAGKPVPPDLQKYLDKLPGAAQTGLNTNAPQGQQAPQQQAAPQPQQRSQLSPHDQQALSWAQANPNDPRAAKIKQKLGVQ